MLTAGIGAVLALLAGGSERGTDPSLVGAGLAGTYMPGLQILNARLTRWRIRAFLSTPRVSAWGQVCPFSRTGTVVHFDHHVAA